MSDTLPDRIEGLALFLDFDGTLVEIADTPGGVVVPPELPALLTGVATKAGGALAVVSGRTIDALDRFLAPARFPSAGVHGGELRLPNGERVKPSAPGGEKALQALRDFGAAHPALLIEDKGFAIALHYRAAPELAAEAIAAAERAAGLSATAVAVQHGKMMVELRPAGADKGRALSLLMEHAAFAGRRPVAIGDDLTDEAMLATARALGGIGVHVGPPGATTVASARLADPAAVLAWLAALR